MQSDELTQTIKTDWPLCCVKNIAPLPTRKPRNAHVNDADHGQTSERRDDNDEDAGENARNGAACVLLDLQHQVPPELVLLLRQHVQVERHVVEPVGRVLDGRC